MTNKMATRFEPARDEGGLWSLAAACTAFARGGESGDAECAPCDDEQRHRASSSSPEGCFDGFGHAAYSGCLSLSGAMPKLPFAPSGVIAGFHPGVENMLASSYETGDPLASYNAAGSPVDLPGKPGIRAGSCNRVDGLSMRTDAVSPTVNRCRESPPAALADAGNEGREPRRPVKNLPACEQNGDACCGIESRDVDVALPLATDLKQEPSPTFAQRRSSSVLGEPSKQGTAESPQLMENGGEVLCRTPRRPASRTRETTCGAVKRSLTVDSTREKAKTTSDNFAECDAAEALLNLFTAIPSANQGPSASVRDTTARAQFQDSAHAGKNAPGQCKDLRKCHSCDDATGKSPLPKETEEAAEVACVHQEPCETPGAHARSGLHFKKAICLKFAELKGQSGGQPSTEVNKSSDGARRGAAPSEAENGAAGNGQRAVSGCDGNNNNNASLFAEDVRAESVSNTRQGAAPGSQTPARAQTTKPAVDKGRDATAVKANNAASRCKATARTVEGKTGKSNLYRIASTLGSSSESLCASDQDNPDQACDSDSSSQYTSESDDEDSQHSDEEGSPAEAQETNPKSPAVQEQNHKRRFVLSKPKFSLPARADRTKAPTPTLQFASGPAGAPRPFAQAGKAFGAGTDSLPAAAFVRMESEAKKGSCKRSAPATTKNSGHIKKATFKFHSSTTHASPKDEQKATNHAFAHVLATKSAVCCEAPFAIQAKRAPDVNDSKTAPVFGTYKGGASFELLSTERAVQTFRGAPVAKSKTHTPFPYDKTRLPQPTARSPALEAKQLEKLKPGRKRKAASKALNFTSSARKALRSIEPDGIKTDTRQSAVNGRSPSEDRSWKEMAVGADDDASNASSRSSSLDTYSSGSSVTSSSRASSLAGDEPLTAGKGTGRRSRSPSRVSRGSRRSSARNLKRIALRNKRRRSAVRDSTRSAQPPGKEERLVFQPSTDECAGSGGAKATSDFRLLSCFPVPASLTAGPARGELLPCPSASVARIPARLAPFRWAKGLDVRETKQKRQRERWRHLTLDMFCMGTASR